MLTTKPTEKPCARCEALLFEATEADFALLGCGRCGGAWMSNEDAGELLAGKAAMAKVLGERLASKTVVNPALLATEPKCPECREKLKVVKVNGVELDVCADHGTWFDRSEIAAVTKAPPDLRLAAAAAAGAPFASPYPAAIRYRFLAIYGKLCFVFAGLTALAGFLLLLDGCHAFDKPETGLYARKLETHALNQFTLLLGVVVVTLTWLAMAQACKLLLDLADRR